MVSCIRFKWSDVYLNNRLVIIGRHFDSFDPRLRSAEAGELGNLQTHNLLIEVLRKAPCISTAPFWQSVPKERLQHPVIFFSWALSQTPAQFSEQR